MTISTNKRKNNMPKSHSYACKDYPGMEACPAQFTAETEGELWKMIELHATVAHAEDPAEWSGEDKAFLRKLIKSA